ncbi:MAG: transcriptional repressor LexA [Lentisphaeria bacterium]
MKGLTAKQQNVLDYIMEFAELEGMAPTINEIAEHFSINSTTAFSHIRSLQRKEYITRSSKARSLAVVNAQPARHFSLTLSIPLLGRISAGAPLFSEEHIERQIHIDPSLLPKRISASELFALQVQGDSMRDLGILDGDIVVAKKAHNVGIGDIIIALIDDETTVKSLYLSDGQWELRPANPDYKSLFLPLEKLLVQGVVVALQRAF